MQLSTEADGVVENTPVIPSGVQEVLQLKCRPETTVYVYSSALWRWFGDLFDTANYRSTLTQEQLIERAFAKRERGFFRALQQDCDDAFKDLLARAVAHVDRLGIGFRQRIYAEAVKERVSR